jgi:hypothetical protein
VRRVYTHVRLNEQRFDIIPGVVVNFRVAEHLRDASEKALPRFRQPTAENAQ